MFADMGPISDPCWNVTWPSSKLMEDNVWSENLKTSLPISFLSCFLFVRSFSTKIEISKGVAYPDTFCDSRMWNMTNYAKQNSIHVDLNSLQNPHKFIIIKMMKSTYLLKFSIFHFVTTWKTEPIRLIFWLGAFPSSQLSLTRAVAVAGFSVLFLFSNRFESDFQILYEAFFEYSINDGTTFSIISPPKCVFVSSVNIILIHSRYLLPTGQVACHLRLFIP